MISLDCNQHFFKLRALPGSANFAEDRDKAKKLPGRRPIWAINPVTKKNEFQYWEIPRHAIHDITSRWEREQIIATDAAGKVIDGFNKVLQLPFEMEPISDSSFDWGKIVPKSYQKQYVLINPQKNRLICSFWLGMGKTYGTLLRAKILGFNKLLVVSPANPNLRKKWVKSIRNVFGADCNLLNYEGTPNKRKKLFAEKLPAASVVVVSHAMCKELSDQTFDQIIIDEAHNLCNRLTKVFKSIAKLVHNNSTGGLQLATGTPINHKMQDLWALMHLIDQQVAGDFAAWEKRYVKVLRSFPKKFKWGIKHIALETEPQNTDEMRERITPFIVRVSPEGHITFKDTTEIIPITLGERQRDIYNEVRKTVLKEIDEEGATGAEGLQKTMKVIRACEGAYHINPEWEDSAKMDYVVQELMAAKETGEKIVVWSISVDTIERLHAKFRDCSVMFHGGLTKNVRNMSVWSFHGIDSDEDQAEFDAYVRKYDWVLKPGEAQFMFGVVHPKSCTGIDLHGVNRFVARQIFMSFHWNPNANFQAKGRLSRIGQAASEVKTEFLVAERTFEKRAILRILRHYQYMLDVLDGKASEHYKANLNIVSDLRRCA